VLAVIVIVAAATTANSQTSPWAGAAGRVGVDAAVKKYPVLAAALNDPELSTQEKVGKAGSGCELKFVPSEVMTFPEVPAKEG
jgi:hypothetical protein